MNEAEKHPYLPVGDGNTLILKNTEQERAGGQDNDDDYFEEKDSSNNIVATYHVWHHLNIYPPQKVNKGWKKFDSDGVEILAGDT